MHNKRTRFIKLTDYEKNALIRYGIFFLFLLGYSSLFAQNSIDELWKKAEAALEANEEYAAVANLEKIVMSTGLFDEPAIQSRLVLAELSLMGTDMEKIYESYAYFNCLHQTQDPHHRYGDLTRQLKHRYDSLLQVDMSQGITPDSISPTVTMTVMSRPCWHG